MSHARWVLGIAGWLCWGTSHAVGLQATAGMAADEARERIHFDIEPQPLSTAVKAFSDATGQALLVDERLLTGRLSPGARGDFTAESALRRLLAGTGLREHYTTDKAFTLVPVEPVSAADGEPDAEPAAEAPLDEAYGYALQSAVEVALCRSASTRPGDYRLALQVWVDPQGEVEQTRLLGSTGQPARDEAIESALKRVQLEPPPAALGQPLTLLLLPAGSSRAARCQPAAATHR